MRKIIGLAWLLLFSGSAHALVISATLPDDEVDYYNFSTGGGAFSIDVLASDWGDLTGNKMSDPELWL